MRVAVAVSGGVDSAVAALLLKKQGHKVLGVHMSNWDAREEDSGICSGEEDLQSAQAACKHIGIQFKHVNFVKEYWNNVFSQVLCGYERGHTPNPDVLCNAQIKFRAFYDAVLSLFSVDAIATGHYARLSLSESTANVRLLQAVDTVKDQTYFLSHVPQLALQKTLFPIGHLTKTQVKEVATTEGLAQLAQRKESMGLCFVGKRKFKHFISQYLEESEGKFLSLDGSMLGTHAGHHLYTIGQRARLDGKSHAWFVCGKDPCSNTVTVVEGTHHPALYSHCFTTSQPHWVNTAYKHGACNVRVRHQQPLLKCKFEPASNYGGLYVESELPIRAVTPGQCAVFYNQEECLGGAVIEFNAHI